MVVDLGRRAKQRFPDRCLANTPYLPKPPTTRCLPIAEKLLEDIEIIASVTEEYRYRILPRMKSQQGNFWTITRGQHAALARGFRKVASLVRSRSANLARVPRAQVFRTLDVRLIREGQPSSVLGACAFEAEFVEV